MRIAIATDNGRVAEHFGRCPEYTIIDIEDNKIKEKSSFQNPGHSPGLIPQLMNEKKVNCMIAGGMGRRAVGFFEDFGIKTIIGVTGNIDEVIRTYLEGKLQSSESVCSGHGLGGGGECHH